MSSDPNIQKMATGTSTKVPPPFNAKTDDFNKWLKKFNLWTTLTDIPKVRIGASLVLQLDDDTQDTILELVKEEDIGKENGYQTVIDKLKEIFRKDESITAFEVYEELENYKRPPEMAIPKYCSEFEKRLSKVKTSGTTLSEPLLAFRLLKSANLSHSQNQLVRATINKMDYKSMATQLKKVVGYTNSENSDFIRIKEEGEEVYQNETYYGGKHSYRKNKWQPPPRDKQRYSYGGDRSYNDHRKDRMNYERERQNEYEPRKTRKVRGKNPLDAYGKVTRCRICESINHWEDKCPDRKEQKDTYHEDLLNKSDSSDESDVESLTYEIETLSVCLKSEDQQDLSKIIYSCESLNVAILDSGAPKSVCGTIWLSQYIDTLSSKDKSKVTYSPATNIYKFGCGSKSEAVNRVKFPAVIGEVDVLLKADVVKGELPLLLSRTFMKQAKSELNFKDDTIEILGQNLNLLVTRSGHYALPLGRNKQLMVDSARQPDISLTLHVKNITAEATAIKLHRQFAHPPPHRLIKLVQNKGEECSELIDAIKEISAKCQVCKQYKRPQPRPVVGFPVATTFNECVALDLKQFGDVYLLHMIDSATRLSAGAVIRRKKPEIIIRELFNHWISIYGTPGSLLSDNGREFNNKELLELGEKCNIKIKTTAAESPWSNGLVERHNQILGDMILKTREDTGCSLEMAVMWCITAHNSLSDVHGFSPFQLVFGRNPALPSLQNNKPPALNDETVNDMIRKNLNALHASRQAKIKCESDERLRRALNHNIRTSNDVVFVAGDRVYYKRKDTKKWKGPATVMAKDGQQVLLKHGGLYIKVHPCRLSLCQETDIGADKNSDKTPHESDLNESSNLRTDEEEEENQTPCPIENNNTTNQAEPPRENQINNTTNQVELSKQNQLQDTTNQLTEETGSQQNISNNDEQNSQNINDQSNKDLKKGMRVRYKETKQDEWETTQLTSRAGKSTGAYSKAWNTINEQGIQKYVNFDAVNEWQIINNLPNTHIFTTLASIDTEYEEEIEIYVSESEKNNSKEEINQAKVRELNSWKENKVYEEVEFSNQQCISGRWILKPKIIDGIQSMKARYVLRGFEEDQDFRTDSPTCLRETLRLALALFPTQRWRINSIDFKTAFLQGGPIDRDIFVKPPKEAKTQKLWKLKKTAYGLKDAPREWYLRLKNEIVRLGCKMSSIDCGLFMMHEEEKLIGLLLVFVDDLLWGGDKFFENTVIQKLKTTFTVGCEQSRVFKYVGINLIQEEDYSITLDQVAYINSINTIPITSERSTQINDTVTADERKQLRSALGKLNWISCTSRPDIRFNVGEIRTSKQAKVENILKANKTITHVKNTLSDIKFPKFSCLQNVYLKVYTDASYANLEDKGSMGGHVVFLTDGFNACPIAWQAKKIQRIVRSTTAAETLALVEGCERAYLMARLFTEITTGINEMPDKPIICVTDNNNLFKSSTSTNALEDKRLQLEMNIVRQMVSRKEIELLWCNGQNQLSDVLTKEGASGVMLRQVLHNGHF